MRCDSFLVFGCFVINLGMDHLRYLFSLLYSHASNTFLCRMSATVDICQMRKQLRNKKALCIGICLQFVILPFVGFVVVKLLKMDAAIGVTLLVVTSSPGGSYSNCEYYCSRSWFAVY